MNTRPYSVAFVVMLLTFPILHVSAATFLAPQGESASVRSEVVGDVYAANNAVVIAAPVHGDIFAAGESVDISGASDSSIFALGRTLTVSGTAKDDVRVAGNTVSLTAATAHDVFAAGSTVFLGPQSSVGGDAYLGGSDITIAGTIQGTLHVAGERVTIAKQAVIRGDVIAYQNKPIIEDGATIDGKTTTIISTATNKQSNRQDGMGRLIKSAASRALLAFVLLWIAPMFIKSIKDRAHAAVVHSGLLGLATIILFIPLALIIAITGIGLPVAVLVLISAMLLIVIGMGSSTLLLGSYLMKLVAAKDSSPSLSWQHAVVGGVAAALIMLAGGIGFLILSIIFLIALGATMITLKHTIHA